MASGSRTMLEETFMCAICLDLYTDPATAQCGHSFCKACLEGYWATMSWNRSCPLCKANCSLQPTLQVNYVLRDMVENFKQMARADDGEAEASTDASTVIRRPNPESGDVLCDMCLGDRQKAVKSCLACMMSYCDEHIRSHRSRFTKHSLVEPVANMEDRMCKKHEMPLELFCKAHHTYSCVECMDHEGPGHEVVSMRREYVLQKARLQRTSANATRRLNVALEAASDYNSNMQRTKRKAERELRQVESLCRSQIGYLKCLCKRFIMEAQRRIANMELVASRQSQKMEAHVGALTTRREELESLVSSTDPLYFLKKLPSVRLESPRRMPTCECPKDLLATPLQAFKKAFYTK